jgi:hypothetical protein
MLLRIFVRSCGSWNCRILLKRTTDGIVEKIRRITNNNKLKSYIWKSTRWSSFIFPYKGVCVKNLIGITEIQFHSSDSIWSYYMCTNGLHNAVVFCPIIQNLLFGQKRRRNESLKIEAKTRLGGLDVETNWDRDRERP